MMQSTHSQDCVVSYIDTLEGSGDIPTRGDLMLAGNFIWTRASGATVQLKSLDKLDLDRLEGFVARELKKRRNKMIACVHHMSDDKAQDHADAVAFLLETRDAIEMERLRRFQAYLEQQDTTV